MKVAPHKNTHPILLLSPTSTRYSLPWLTQQPTRPITTSPLLGQAHKTSFTVFTNVAGDLSMPDCSTCVARSVSQLGRLCSQTCGGAVQLQGCYVKYDNASFLGVEDKTVALKKCGPSDGYNPDAMSIRDGVLAGLAGSGGPYRVGGSGKIQGVAQCVGDLSFGGCQDCVLEAIRRLKSDCGSADYGDMFLGKCYARYTTGGSGTHVSSKAHNGKSIFTAEKIFAFIIGLLAGIAILIIFLAFLKRICEGPGGK
ncbi:Cysteine-rich repeat secretory protein like [Quillaja saponaria]|uniref:Cysteine-rich repeat secretory protein like n=1 Tax=Quillaja saponaria TaxID=32244 RepID=A0AAD7PR53_QUISA|nr:Cysteine-rich repeat secretory protein like [Quillaja saponaria]